MHNSKLLTIKAKGWDTKIDKCQDKSCLPQSMNFFKEKLGLPFVQVEEKKT